MLSRKTLANAIRALSMDAVQKANSGHPGMPMGMADIAETLWNDFLKHNPQNPNWVDRDRFILSNGHGCLLQYALLHLSGYDLKMEDLKQFRQLHSRTPGHPEYGITPGVESTTGPLGQGFANAVGMALSEAILAQTFNREAEGHNIVDHYTYCFMGDGCMMEGISHEAASLAGTLGLGKLIVFYDDNGISIDGKVKEWFLDNTPKRFEAYGWHVIADVDGHDSKAVFDAIQASRQITDKPSLICCKTIIGYGAPKLAGTAKTHGSPLGEAEVAAARQQLGWEYPAFFIPPEIYAAWDARKKGETQEKNWQQRFAAYKKAYPELATEFERRMNDQLPSTLESELKNYALETEKKAENCATRLASQRTLTLLVDKLPELFGGSADLSESNLTLTPHSKPLSPHHPLKGNYLFYGVREFAMAAIMNGMALHKGFIPYGGTFLVFLDYCRNATRLAALSQQRVIYVFSHDSIGLGEDGPTHQPIEHLGLLRTTPNMSVWRPCDSTETAVAWGAAIRRREGPTSLVLTRQSIPHQAKTPAQVAAISRGGYVLVDCEERIDAIVIATGSEVSIAVSAAKRLLEFDIHVRVVSMPSTDVFLSQDPAYRESVLPRSIKARVAIEAGATAFWYQWVGREGMVLGIDSFGESAPFAQIYEALGLTVNNLMGMVRSVLATQKAGVL